MNSRALVRVFDVLLAVHGDRPHTESVQDWQGS